MCVCVCNMLDRLTYKMTAFILFPSSSLFTRPNIIDTHRAHTHTHIHMKLYELLANLMCILLFYHSSHWLVGWLVERVWLLVSAQKTYLPVSYNTFCTSRQPFHLRCTCAAYVVNASCNRNSSFYLSITLARLDVSLPFINRTLDCMFFLSLSHSFYLARLVPHLPSLCPCLSLCFGWWYCWY